MTTFQVTYSELGRCICGACIRVDSFRDERSYQEFYRRALCQTCLDRTCFAASERDPATLFPLHRGALVASKPERNAVTELGILPFLFVVPEPRVAWEARFLVRVGTDLHALDPFDEFRPMQQVLEGHQIRLHEVESLSDASCVREHLAELDLLIGLHPSDIASACSLCSLPAEVSSVALSDGQFPWRTCTLLPLERWWPFPTKDPSVLRTCALMGRALGLSAPGRSDRTPIQHLVAGLADRFEQVVPDPAPLRAST